MKALMSERFRQIINDPQGKKALQQGIFNLCNKTGTAETTEICVGGTKYKIGFTQRTIKTRDK